MTDPTTTDDYAVRVLSISGAMCGTCGDEPGDQNCADCERVRRGYIADLRAAGWAPAASAVSLPPADQTAELVKLVTRSIFALKTPSPDGSKHYQSGWDDGLEAAMDATRGALVAVLPATTDQPADAPAAECSAQHRSFDDGRLCIRAAQHQGDHIDERGYHWSNTVAVYPVADGTFRPGTDVRAALRRMADETPADETAHQPRRGDQFEAWLKRERDDYASDRANDLLDRYRLHADMGVPLGGHVCEARMVGDCECLEQPVVGCGECGHPKAAHEEGDDPVTPGQCADCPDGEDRHDYRTAAVRQDWAES